MLTLSIVKAGTGGHAGHSAVHPALLATASSRVSDAVDAGMLIDGTVAACGDDLSLIMTHTRGAGAGEIHGFARDVFQSTIRVAGQHGISGSGQDYAASSGSLSYAELELVERPSEPVICFLADKTEPGAWNLPLYKIFADPFNTPGLVIDPTMRAGFRFEVHDLYEHRRIWFHCPADLYELLMFIGAPSRFVVRQVVSRTTDEVAAATSTQRLSLVADGYVDRDDPVMIVRAQSGLPEVGEVLEPFAFPYSVAGAMRGSHHAPLMPVGAGRAHPSRFDGPPRVVALGFQLHEGRLGQPRDLFDDPAFDEARRQANLAMDYLRRHGPFEPHRLSLAELEDTTMPQLAQGLADRWEPLPSAPSRRDEPVAA